MKFRALLIALFVLPITALCAEDAGNLITAIKRDLEKRDANPIANIQYVVTEDLKERTNIFRVTVQPDRQTRILLLSVDRRPSNENEIIKFSRERNSYDPTDRDFIDRWVDLSKLSALIDEGSLIPTQSDDAISVFNFTCKTKVGDSGEPIDLEGSLTYDRKGGFVSSMELSKKKAFKAGDDGKIDTFYLRVSFEKDAKVRAIVMSSIAWNVSGKKSMFKALEDNYQANFDDYRQN